MIVKVKNRLLGNLIASITIENMQNIISTVKGFFYYKYWTIYMYYIQRFVISLWSSIH